MTDTARQREIERAGSRKSERHTQGQRRRGRESVWWRERKGRRERAEEREGRREWREGRASRSSGWGKGLNGRDLTCFATNLGPMTRRFESIS